MRNTPDLTPAALLISWDPLTWLDERGPFGSPPSACSVMVV
jgi:hypothetical protein